jgi:Phosphate-starvation-inducible E.
MRWVLKDTLFVIFGLFLNVLIALEILENITAYLKKHVIQVELVIVTSLIAVSRKIIILDLEKKTAADFDWFVCCNFLPFHQLLDSAADK